MTNRDRIAEHLSALARAWRRAEIREKTVLWTGVALLACTCGIGFAQVGWTAAGLSTIGTAIVSIAIAALFVATRTLASITGERMKLARMAEHLSPDLGTGPTSAVDFADRLENRNAEFRNFSEDLAEAHLEEMADALGRARLVQRLEAERRSRDARAWKIAAGCFAVLLVAVVTLRTGRQRLITWLADPTAARISETPLASDITLKYAFPAYTGLAPRVVEGGDGSISAVVGTQVNLSATADNDVRSGLLRLFGSDGKPTQEVPLAVDGKKLAGVIPVLRDGSYAFELVTRGGERLQDGLRHPVRATLDSAPEITMDSPAGDVELKDDHSVDILWRAKDDYGVGDTQLVIEKPGAAEATIVPLSANASDDAKLREGQYRWSVAELGIKPGEEVRFHLETVDNDTINGPKKGSSETHRLTIFSARQRHDDLLEEQRAILDAMVSLLADELENPYPRELGDSTNANTAQNAIIEKMMTILHDIQELSTSLRDDKMSTPQIVAAFDNVAEHISKARFSRGSIMQQASARSPTVGLRKTLADTQAAAVKQLEKDILYLDDLLAVQRIHELKETAKDLLASQRELQKLIDDFKKTKDPALQAELQKRIGELRDKMNELLAKMAEIKQGLPGEYRNMEAATMLQMDDQLARIDKALREGKLDEAAAELEQLANSVENMMNSVNEAEKEYGGERYDELRKSLSEFAQEFREIEKEQKDLADKSDDLLKDYRKEAAKRAGSSVQDLIKKAREKTSEALREMDKIEAEGPQMYGNLRSTVDSARQRLMDMDSLLEQHDYSEARAAGQSAEDREREMEGMLSDRVPYGGREQRDRQENAAKAADRAVQRTREVNQLLDKLFPEPGQVLSQDQMQQIQRNQKRQGQLEQQARALGQKMDALSQDVPLFGGESRGQLENARGEMDKAIGQMQGGHLPGAASSERRAADELGKLREQLEKASQGGNGSLPLPLAGGRGGNGRDSGQPNGATNRDVQIPQSDKNRAAPRFRQELLEAAKQKAPQNYEDAVRKYYEELIK